MNRSARTATSALVSILVGVAISVAIASAVAPGLSITGKYFLVFDDGDCNLPGAIRRTGDSCTQPKFSRVHLLQSDDGAAWRPVPGFEAYPGDVPDAVRRGDTLYIYANMMNPDQRTGLQVRKYHFDTDTWDDPVYVDLRGGRGPYLPGRPDTDFPIEESAIVDDAGRIVVFYRLWYDHAQGAGEPGFVEYIRSATEVEGSDGTAFTVDAGERFTITTGTGSSSPQTVANPEVFRGPGIYVMYLGSRAESGEMRILALGSTTLRGDYTPLDGLRDGVLVTGLAPHPGGYYDPVTKKYWSFTVPSRPTPKDVILRATHDCLNRQLSASQFRTVVRLEDVPGSDRTYIDGADGGLTHPRFAVNEPFPAEVPADASSACGASDSSSSGPDKNPRD